MMKRFNGKISLTRNGRGCYIIDTVKGCSICRSEKPLGCYDNCYALNIASRYGIDFTNSVNRDFEQNTAQSFLFDMEDESHLFEIIKQIRDVEMPFVRIGEMGDPSDNWGHTVEVCKKISEAGKPIVIITKHWNTIDDKGLELMRKIGACINTSISALDSDDEIRHRLEQYERIKGFCKSVLRVVSCDFNIDNKEGLHRELMQGYLLNMPGVLETVFRPSKSNRLVTDGVINVKKVKFLGANCLASMRNENLFIGYCFDCPDMCGINTDKE